MADLWRSMLGTVRPGLPASLRAMMLASLLVPLGFLAISTTLDHRRLLAEAHADAGRLSNIASEHALKVIETDLLILERMADRIQGLSWAEISSQAGVLHEWLRTTDERLGQISLLQYLDTKGEVKVRSEIMPSPPPRLAVRDWFTALAGGAKIAFGAPIRRPNSDVIHFAIAQRMESADGAFSGVAAGSILLDYFLDHWRTLTKDGRAAFAMIRTDGAILVAQPTDVELLRAAAADMPLDTADATDPPGLRLVRLGTRQDILAGFRQVGRYPLLVTAMIPLDRVFATWWHNTLVTALICLAAAAGLSFATLLACRRWLSEQATLQALRAEAARREAVEADLAQAQRLESLGRLTGGVAHDSNNLLTAVLGTAHMLERHLGAGMDARTRHLLEVLREAVHRGASLNRSLLAFARRQKLDPVSLDANALAQDFAPLMRRAIGETHPIVLALAPDLPACRADAGQLESALLNLAINARDAMPDGGTITIATRRARLNAAMLQGNPDARPGNFVAISVKDTGLGMPQAVRERAFEPFFTTKPTGRGTGLGLSQVFGVIRQLGGHIGLESTAGIGTLVTLYLPESNAPIVARPAAPAPAAAAAHCPGRVLLVEDDPDVREIAAEMLNDAGLRVTAMPDGAAALRWLKGQAPCDLLFSDIVMPGALDGIALAEAARTLRPGLPVLLATGYAGRGAYSTQHEFEVLSKPYDQAALLRRVTALLRAAPADAAAAPAP
jgi:two-component system, NtrC family, sensor kinase